MTTPSPDSSVRAFDLMSIAAGIILDNPARKRPALVATIPQRPDLYIVTSSDDES